MTINRYSARSDPNQAAIKKALENAGYQVFIIKRPCDLLAEKNGRVYMVEVKQPGKEKDLTPFQRIFFPSWPVIIVTTPEEALQKLNEQ